MIWIWIWIWISVFVFGFGFDFDFGFGFGFWFLVLVLVLVLISVSVFKCFAICWSLSGSHCLQHTTFLARATWVMLGVIEYSSYSPFTWPFDSIQCLPSIPV